MPSLNDIIVKCGKSPARFTLIFSLPVVAVLVALLALLAVRDDRNNRRHFELQLLESARAYYRQVLLTRSWNAWHQGVYVEVTDETQPNPYLEDPERDIVSMGGKHYTKVNPAFMTRQMSEIAEAGGRYKFRLRSLRPLNPANSPDEWEAEALRSFEEGEPEEYVLAEYQGEEYFRYMAPLEVKEECLFCHAKHGYKVGDIRGGLSVAIPTKVLREIQYETRMHSLEGLGALGMVAVALVVAVVWVLGKRLVVAFGYMVEAERLKSAVQLASAAAHELRQPMTVISGLSEMVLEKSADDEPPGEELNIIVDQCQRMDGIIVKMLNLTSAKTKHYDGDTEIIDLDSGAEGQAEDQEKS